LARADRALELRAKKKTPARPMPAARKLRESTGVLGWSGEKETPEKNNFMFISEGEG
jgi:hypothetical protein